MSAPLTPAALPASKAYSSVPVCDLRLADGVHQAVIRGALVIFHLPVRVIALPFAWLFGPRSIWRRLRHPGRPLPTYPDEQPA